MILVIKSVIYSANEISYYQLVRYLLRIQQYPVNNTYNIMFLAIMGVDGWMDRGRGKRGFRYSRLGLAKRTHTIGLFAGLGLGLGLTIEGILFCCTFHNIFKLDTHCT